MRMRLAPGRFLVAWVTSVLAAVTAAPAWAAQTIPIQIGTSARFLANRADPGIGLAWTTEAYDDASWGTGTFGFGYETRPPGATNLIRTAVPAGTYSVYARARFTIADISQVTRLLFGADYDDGYVAWINGAEVARSTSMPPGNPAWNTNAASHESSNGLLPNYGTLIDITARALPFLHGGENVLAIGVWNNNAPSSSDLVVVPQLTLNPTIGVTRGPYLQSGTPTSVVVRWRTAAPTDSRVRYGTDPGSPGLSAGNAPLTTEHVVALTGLDPETRYYYSVGTSAEPLAGGDASHFFETSPEPGTRGPTRIWVIGDSGTANASARAVRDAYTTLAGGRYTDLWLMLGDNAYPDGTDAQYQTAVFGMYPQILRQTVLWPTLGNHDGITADSATQSGPYYNIFTLPRSGEAGGLPSGTEAYYSFDHGNVHFICLESYETNRSPGGAMMTWLQQDVLATDKDWIIAFWHHPPYSKGSHNSDTEIELIQMRQNALPLLEQGGVDLVLAGHSHSYERSFLLDGHYGLSSTFDPVTMRLDGGDGRVDGAGAYRKLTAGPAPHEGAVYVVAGSSGQTSGGTLNHPAMFLSLNVLGSLVLDVNGLELNARFIDNTGAPRDYFTLLKGPVVAPEADFSADPLRGAAPLTVRFTDRSRNAPVAWGWDFEADGSVDSGEQNPLHVYDLPGLYAVRLTASSAAGQDTATRPDYICALSADGTADADGDGAADGVDVCPCDADPGQEDTDRDGSGDACDDDDDGDGVSDADDCAPLSKGVSSPPEPIADTLRLAHTGEGTLRWERSRGGHTSNVYRGTIPHAGGLLWDAICAEAETPRTESVDPDAPPTGTAFYYLVSARNTCGESPAGRDGAGRDIVPDTPCPKENRESDGDGRPDLGDNCPLRPNPGQDDTDADTAGDACDNCPGSPNPGQRDVDADQTGDVCDNCPAIPNPDQLNSDGDAAGNLCDLDDDNDGVEDEADCAPLDASASAPPGPVGASLTVGEDARSIGWDAVPGASYYHLYRGTFSRGAPFTYDHACFEARRAGPGALDPEVPAPASGFYYLATAANVCGEGIPGTASDGLPRPLPAPCP